MVRLRARVALMHVGADRFPGLLAAMEDPNPEVRRDAVSFARPRTPEQRAQLVRILKQLSQDPDSVVRQEAQAALDADAGE